METEILRLERKFQKNTEVLRDDISLRFRDLEHRIAMSNSTIEHQAAMLREDISNNASKTRDDFYTGLSGSTAGLVQGLAFVLAFGVLGYWAGS